MPGSWNRRWTCALLTGFLILFVALLATLAVIAGLVRITIFVLMICEMRSMDWRTDGSESAGSKDSCLGIELENLLAELGYLSMDGERVRGASVDFTGWKDFGEVVKVGRWEKYDG